MTKFNLPYERGKRGLGWAYNESQTGLTTFFKSHVYDISWSVRLAGWERGAWQFYGLLICEVCQHKQQALQKIHLHWESKIDTNPNQSHQLFFMLYSVIWRGMSSVWVSKALGSEVRCNRVKWLLHNNPVFTSGKFPKTFVVLICILGYLKHKHSQEWLFFLSCPQASPVLDFWWIFMFLWVSPHHLPSLCHSVLLPPVLALYCYKCEALSHPCILCSQVRCLTVLEPAYCRVRVYMLSVIELVSWLFMCVYDVVC